MVKTMNKWIGISLGGVLGLSHIGMIGMIANRPSKLPTINVPVGQYTSYEAMVGEDGYTIKYRSHDPKTVLVERDIKKKAGFLGFGNNIIKETKEVPVSTDPTTQLKEYDKVAKTEACIEAIGGGKQTGKMVGASVGAAVAPSLTGIPYVGWVLAGAATMMGMDQGAEIGGNMVEELNENC